MKFNFLKKGQYGFSLVEVLVVVSSIVLLSGFGFATLVITQRRQVVDQAALNIQQMIQKAKFNSISRVRTTGVCTTTKLSSYQMKFTTNTVTLNPVCKDSAGITSDAAVVESKTFPSAITITLNGCSQFAFEILTNRIVCTAASGSIPSVITVTGYGTQKRLDIDSSGNTTITTVTTGTTLADLLRSLLGF